MTTMMHPAAHQALVQGRQAMAGLYTDRVEVTRYAVEGDDGYVADVDRAMDPETFQRAPQGRVVVYRGPGRLQVKADINSNVVEATAGDREATYLTAQLQTPVEASELAAFPDRASFVGDPALIDVDYTLRIVSAPFDSSLPGRLFKVAGPYHKSQGVYRRFRLNEAV